ncbi:SNO1-like protein [Mya arenaria]|uniref:Flavin-containing monooxygenase n=1 Tax=Mya arenaria TaxID=6604 RepID=A0ABY7EH96_MYAAR|nr:SNO1-like protein [Mya arenaria]
MSDKRICIIGAGPSGMFTLSHFVSLGAADDVVCFEKQATWGGLWNYNWKTGVDEHGEPVHASMYKYLWLMGGKELNEYPDYTYEDHFGKLTPSFPNLPNFPGIESFPGTVLHSHDFRSARHFTNQRVLLIGAG